MEFKKNLARNFLRACKIGHPSLTDCRISTSRVAVKTRIPPGPERVGPDPVDDRVFRRFMHRRPVYDPVTLTSFPAGENLAEKLRDLDVSRDRIRLDGLVPPPSPENDLTVAEARRLLRLSRLERVKDRLKGMEKDYISYSEFLGVCSDDVGVDSDEGLEFARMLDGSGDVIVLGNVVFLKPRQILKAIEGLIPKPKAEANDPRKKELEEMEKEMTVIDQKATLMAKKELWAGLGFFVAQTAVFLRLTFWELTWDVMEPICFYVTSTYAIGAYAFFLMTSKEPSYEGFFQTRVSAKKKRLIKLRNFDFDKYNTLKKN